MKRWNTLLQVLDFPIKLMVIALVFLGLSNFILNPVFSGYINISNELVILFAEALAKISYIYLLSWPFVFFIRLVSKKVNGVITIYIGLVGYITYIIFTMFFQDTTLVSQAYFTEFGFQLSNSSLSAFSNKVIYPLRTGIIGVILITVSTRIAYRQSRRRSKYGLFAFVDKDIWGMLLNILYAIIIAFVICQVAPLAYQYLATAIKFISNDLSNPISLFAYGILDRILSILNLSDLIKAPFWFATNGGSWVNVVGEAIGGDVNIWTEMLQQNLIPLSAGRFITPYYVMNIFGIPGILWGIWSMYSNKVERRKNLFLFLVLTVLSMLIGLMLPLEIVLLLLAPLLFIIYVLIYGSLFAIFQGIHAVLGFSYSGKTEVALPGNLLEFLSFIGRAELQNTLITVVVVGVITGLVYFLVTRLYFKYLAVDLFDSGSKHRISETIITSVGGVNNIKFMSSSVNCLVIKPSDPNLVDLSYLKELGVSKIIDTKAGYALYLGAPSTMIKRLIENKIRASLRQV